MRIRAKINHEMELLEREIKNCKVQLSKQRRTLVLIQRLVLLDSVGCFIDPITGLLHTKLTNGDPDLDPGMSTHIEDVCEEWTSSLSTVDHNATVLVRSGLPR